MSGINKAIILGNLGKDPDTKYTASGSAVCSFSIATSETWKDKNTGEKQEKTEWHNIAAFGKLAEICSQYLTKGSKVYIEGKIQTDKYQKEGVDHYSTKIIAQTMQMLDSRNNQSQPAQQQPAPAAEDGFDDDIHFNQVVHDNHDKNM